MEQNSRAERLRAAVTDSLIPHVRSRGFEDDRRLLFEPDPSGDLYWRFMRRHEGKLELLEIQFDRYGGSKFVMNLGVVPPEGATSYQRHRIQDECGIAHLKNNARLYAGPAWRMRWFGYPLWMPILRRATAESVVEQAIALFPQAEAWLREGEVGSNINVAERARSREPAVGPPPEPARAALPRVLKAGAQAYIGFGLMLGVPFCISAGVAVTVGLRTGTAALAALVFALYGFVSLVIARTALVVTDECLVLKSALRPERRIYLRDIESSLALPSRSRATTLEIRTTERARQGLPDFVVPLRLLRRQDIAWLLARPELKLQNAA